jgi:cytosine/creatinine deaminase
LAHAGARYRTGVDDEQLLQVAIEQARIGRAEGGVPIGAAILIDGKVVAAGHNRRVQLGSAIRHGETDALEAGGRLPASMYRRATMATTLSPCDMCTGAILLYGIPRLVIGENRTFYGGEDYLRSRGVEVVNLDSAECRELMQEFIAEHPEIWNEDIGEESS